MEQAQSVQQVRDRLLDQPTWDIVARQIYSCTLKQLTSLVAQFVNRFPNTVMFSMVGAPNTKLMSHLRLISQDRVNPAIWWFRKDGKHNSGALLLVPLDMHYALEVIADAGVAAEMGQYADRLTHYLLEEKGLKLLPVDHPAISGGCSYYEDREHKNTYEHMSESEQDTQSDAVTFQLHKAGRPTDCAYDRAAEFIRSGTTCEDAFRWFCKSEGIVNPDKNARDSFKNAMKRRGIICRGRIRATK